LDRYANEGKAFLTRIVTGDETWVHHFAPESKRQSMEWKNPESPVKKKFKSQASSNSPAVCEYSCVGGEQQFKWPSNQNVLLN
jgi:hypothetical protein